MALSSPKPASDRSVVAAAFAAIALFVVSWTLLHVGFYTHKQLIDTPVYQRYGNAIADGKFRIAISRSSTRRVRCPSSPCPGSPSPAMTRRCRPASAAPSRR